MLGTWHRHGMKYHLENNFEETDTSQGNVNARDKAKHPRKSMSTTHTKKT